MGFTLHKHTWCFSFAFFFSGSFSLHLPMCKIEAHALHFLWISYLSTFMVGSSIVWFAPIGDVTALWGTAFDGERLSPSQCDKAILMTHGVAPNTIFGCIRHRKCGCFRWFLGLIADDSVLVPFRFELSHFKTLRLRHSRCCCCI